MATTSVFSKSEKDAIRRIVKNILKRQAGECYEKLHDRLHDALLIELGMSMSQERPDLPDFEDWKENAIETAFGFKVAPADFHYGGQRFFTHDEAVKYEEEVLKPNGWRLPTTGEWMLLCAEYGTDAKGDDDAEAFREKFNMELNGHIDEEDMDEYRRTFSEDLVRGHASYGNWWSLTANSSNARSLYMNSSSLGPQNSSERTSGFSIRCVSAD